MPAAVVLHAQILHIRPIAREPGGTGLQALKSEPLRLVPTRDISGRRETGGRRVAKVFQELRTTDTAQPLVGIAHNLIAT